MTRCWLLFSVLAALPVTGCFDPPADVKPDADLRDATPIDAEPDAAPACTASTTTCSNDHYVDCGADGTAWSISMARPTRSPVVRPTVRA